MEVKLLIEKRSGDGGIGKVGEVGRERDEGET